MAMEIFKLVGSVFVDTDAADKSLKKTDKNAEGLGSKLLAAGKTAGKFAAGVAGACVAAGAALVGVAENTREYRTEQGKLNTAFINSGFAAETARATYSELNGVLGDSGQAVEAANHLAALCDNEEQLATMTEAMTGIYATFGDSLPLEGLAEAANETAKVGTVTGSLADALNWADQSAQTWALMIGDVSPAAMAAFSEATSEGLSVEDAFNAALTECADEQERTELITRALSGAYQEQAYIYKDLNGEIINANIAQDNLNNAMAGIGAAVEPFLTMGKQLLADVLTQLTPILSSLAETVIPLLSSALSSIASVALPIFSAAIQWLADTVLPPLTTALSAVAGWFDGIKTKLGESGITFSTVMSGVQTLFSGAMTFIQGIWTSIGRPVWDLIMQVIDLVYGVFEKNLPAIQQTVSDVFNDIKSIWENNLKPALDAIGQFISNVLAPAFEAVFSNVIAPVVEGAFSTIVSIWDNVLKPALEGCLDFITGVFSGNFSGAFSSLVSSVGDVFSGIVTVVKSPLNKCIGFINKFIRKVNGVTIPDWVPGVGGSHTNIPTIPLLAQGGVLERGQVGLLEGSGAEAVVPLHQNKAWIRRVAEDMDTAIGGANGDQVVGLLAEMLTQIEQIAKMGLYLDSDKLVGGLARKMDRRLGQMQAQKARA